MAFKYAGANSSLSLSNLTAGVYSYSASITQDKLETSNLGNASAGSNWETSIGGMKRGGTVPVRVRYDSTNTIELGDTGSLTLTLESGKTLTCSVWVQTINYTVDVAGLIEQEIVLQITGPVTFPS